MEAPLLSKEGQEISKLTLDESIFNAEVNRGILHQVELAYLAGLRRGTAKTKTRSEVSGGGKKPWKQKGTGRARQGSTRAIQWKGGGIAFGPQPRSFKQNTPRSMRRLALKCALSEKARAQKILVLESLQIEKAKTREIVQNLKKLPLEGKVLILLSKYEANVFKSCKNIAGVQAETVSNINVHELLKCNQIVFLKDAMDRLILSLNNSQETK